MEGSFMNIYSDLPTWCNFIQSQNWTYTRSKRSYFQNAFPLESRYLVAARVAFNISSKLVHFSHSSFNDNLSPIVQAYTYFSIIKKWNYSANNLAWLYKNYKKNSCVLILIEKSDFQARVAVWQADLNESNRKRRFIFIIFKKRTSRHTNNIAINLQFERRPPAQRCGNASSGARISVIGSILWGGWKKIESGQRGSKQLEWRGMIQHDRPSRCVFRTTRRGHARQAVSSLSLGNLSSRVASRGRYPEHAFQRSYRPCLTSPLSRFAKLINSVPREMRNSLSL